MHFTTTGMYMQYKAMREMNILNKALCYTIRKVFFGSKNKQIFDFPYYYTNWY